MNENQKLVEARANGAWRIIINDIVVVNSTHFYLVGVAPDLWTTNNKGFKMEKKAKTTDKLFQNLLTIQERLLLIKTHR